jgi:hypothetical protein
MAEMSEERRQDILSRAREASQLPVTDHRAFMALHWELHALAEEQYRPAVAFFEACLHNVDRNWRESGIKLLGFHYTLESDAIIERIRYHLVDDPSTDVRISAAIILSKHPYSLDLWPDWALLSALQEDPVVQVRQCAIESLLTHAGVEYSLIQETVWKMRDGKLPATTATLKQIVLQARSAVSVAELGA